MMKHIFYLLSISTLFFSCDEVVEVDYSSSSQACLNCILNPDSLINLSLYYSQALDKNSDFIAIENAEITLFENEEEKAKFTHIEGGTYRLNIYPKENKTYRISAVINSSLQLTAETTVPARPSIDTIAVEKVKNTNWRDTDSTTQYYNLTVKYQIVDTNGENSYWNYELLWNYSAQKYIFNSAPSYFSLYADNFNREVDSEKALGFYYHFYVRQTDTSADGGALKFDKNLTSRNKDYFFSADEHYDRYLKSSIQSWIVEEWDELPLSEPVKIYSNVENGTGIFGSAAFTSFNFNK